MSKWRNPCRFLDSFVDLCQNRMEAIEWTKLLKEAQTVSSNARKSELEMKWDEAFHGYVQASSLFLYLIRNTNDSERKSKLREVANGCLERASQIKSRKGVIEPVKRNRLAREEQSQVLVNSTTIQNLFVAIWKAQDALVEPIATPPELPKLSPTQLEADCTWKSAQEALPGAKLFAEQCRGCDVSQGNVSDCSLVSAMIVGIEHHAKFGSKLGLSCLYPQNDRGIPIISKSGIYHVKFFVNGAYRRIVIDDTLPVSSNGDGLFASTRSKDQLWPALLEKAYVKLMGGYDFGGSDSSIDMHALSGWIPERIGLGIAGYQGEKTWDRIVAGFRKGHCIATIGTPSEKPDSEHSDLIPLHNYAVLDFQERDGIREIEIINPWNSDSSDVERVTSWIAWDTVSTHFSSLFVNWDPTIFSNSTMIHSSIKPTGAAKGGNAQFRLRIEPSASPTEVWVLLSRHRVSRLDREFIGLNVTEGEAAGTRGATSLDFAANLVDSPHILFRFKPDPPASIYNLLVCYYDADSGIRFSLHVYGRSAVSIENGPDKFPYSTTINGKWFERSAGGNHSLPTWMNNPQYRLTLKSIPSRPNQLGELSVVCQTSRETCPNVRVLRAEGKRVDEFVDRELIAGDANYSYGYSSCAANELQADTFTLVASNYTADEEGDFEIIVKSTLPLEVSPVPQEGAGMYSRTVWGSWDVLQPSQYIIGVKKSTNLKVRLQNIAPHLDNAISLAIYSVTEGESLDELIETTGAFSDATGGVLTVEFRVAASLSGYVAVPTTSSSTGIGRFVIHLYADQPVTFADSLVA